MKKLLIATTVTIFHFFFLNAQVTEEYGFKAGMNPYSQPNMHIIEGRDSLDYYGSGDVNNDGIISIEDANAIRTGTANDRADVTGNDTVNIADADIIENYLNGTITYLPSQWNHLNRQEKISWFTKMLVIDKTDEKPYISGTYECGDFATETASINLFGLENITNWQYYEKYSEDGDQNAKFNIPAYRVATKTAYIGDTIYYDVLIKCHDIQEIGTFKFGNITSQNLYQNGEIAREVRINSIYFKYNTNTFFLYVDTSQVENEFAFDTFIETEDTLSFFIENGYIEYPIAPGHFITGILAGPESEKRYAEDPTNFSHWYWVDPQADLVVQPGDWSMNEDEYVQIQWYGYFPSFDHFDQHVIINFELEDGYEETTQPSQYLLLSNPNAPDTISPTANFPSDKQIPFEQGMNLEEIIEATPPTNVVDNMDPNPVVSYSYISGQTNNGTCSDVNYNIEVYWNIVDVAGNDTNYTQIVSVVEPEPPTATFPSDKQIPFLLEMNLEETIEATPPTDVVDNTDPNPIVTYTFTSYQTNEEICTDVSYDVAIIWTINDKCGNDTTHLQNIYVRDIESPTFNSPADTSIKEHEGVDPSITGEPTDINDNSGLAVSTSYTDEIDSENNIEKIIKRTWTANDICGNDSSQYQYITVEKTSNIEKVLSKVFGIVRVYPVPTSDIVTLEYLTKDAVEVILSIYDITGRLLDQFSVQSSPNENIIEYSFKEKGIKPGVYSVVMDSKYGVYVSRVVVK